MTLPTLTQISIYPVKSLGGFSAERADVEPRGLRHDRRWMLVEASLTDLNSRLEQPVGMNRFRPNLVIPGASAYAEDGWKKIRIGTALFHAVKPCDRCGLITVDQETGEMICPEPLKTLASYQTQDRKVLFGQFLIPDGPVTVRVGDTLESV